MSKSGYVKTENFISSKKYIVVANYALKIYKDEKDTKVTDEMDLTMVIDCSSDKKGFTVKTASKTFKFVAESPEEAAAWVAAVKAGSKKEIAKRVNVNDFTVLKLVGKGNFGKVFQVKKNDTGEIFAMKVLSKQHIVENNEIQHTMSERSILQRLHHPFLVNLHYSFQSDDKLYLILDFVNGGELFFHLQQDKRFSEDRVRMYAAEILLGLEHLHNAGVIYRDLKLENLLLAPDGHLKITDFGLSKEGLHEATDSTKTFCGTPEYMAPEMLQGKGYTKAVDWWSFGSLVYEMLSGLPPFYSQDVQEMYRRIIKEKLSFSSIFSPVSQEFLAMLLEKDPSKRIGDIAAMKSHAFFKGINWELLVQKKLTPIFVPPVKGAHDVSQIDETFTSEKPDADAVAEGQGTADLTAEEQKGFSGFTYVNENEEKEKK